MHDKHIIVPKMRTVYKMSSGGQIFVSLDKGHCDVDAWRRATGLSAAPAIGFPSSNSFLAKRDFSFNDLSSSSPDLGDDIGPLLRVMLLMGLLH
jgi:hypothetical protein